MKFTALLFALVFALHGFAASNDVNPEPNEWTHYKTVDGVKISYRLSDCEFPEMNWKQRWFLIKMENLDGSTKTVEWDQQIYNGDDCVTCENFNGEYHHTFVIDGNETLQGECVLNEDRTLTVFVKFNDKDNRVVYDRFELGNIMVTR